jgi:hypothetical protein
MDRLAKIFDVTNYEPPVFPVSMNSSTRYKAANPTVVTADRVNELLGAAVVMGDYKVLRFLLRSDGTLVFAHEGTPGGTTPAHYQMSSASPDDAQCIAAGNAYFDRKTNRCCIINHKSGDFRPPFRSLWFALNAFAIANVSMSEQIKLQQLDMSGSCEKEYLIEKKDIMINRLPPLIDKLKACGAIGAKLILQIRRLESGVYSYNPYWMNSSKKLNAIIQALPKDLTEVALKALVRDPASELYQALNMQRLPSILGQPGKTRSLQALQKEDDDSAEHLTL